MTTNVKTEYENGKVTNSNIEGSYLSVSGVSVRDIPEEDNTDVTFHFESYKIMKAENISIGIGYRTVTLIGRENLLVLAPLDNYEKEIHSIEIRRIQSINK